MNHAGGGDGVLDLLACLRCASLGWQSRGLFQEGRCCHSFGESDLKLNRLKSKYFEG